MIEQIREGRIERTIAGGGRRQNKGLEEPCRMGAVPLGRTRIRHRLGGAILNRQGRGKCDGLRANRAEKRLH